MYLQEDMEKTDFSLPWLLLLYIITTMDTDDVVIRAQGVRETF